MIVEDLAAIDDVTEDRIMTVLGERFKRGLYYTYIGDILVFVNPNVPIPVYGFKVSTRRCNFNIYQHSVRATMYFDFSIIASINGNLDLILRRIFMP